MVISVSNTFSHRASCERSAIDQKQLEKTVLEKLEKLGIDSNDIKVNEQGEL